MIGFAASCLAGVLSPARGRWREKKDGLACIHRTNIASNGLDDFHLTDFRRAHDSSIDLRGLGFGFYPAFYR